LYLALNGLSDRSWLFDSLVALAIDNNLVKAAPVAAAFVFAWYRRGTERRAARRALLATLASLLFVLAATKTVADAIFLPRPFIFSQPTYQMDEGRLVESPALPYRVPQEGFSHGRFERLKAGDIEENDLASYPSDHAAFFFALALGIFFASRRAGAFSLAWTLIVICGSRMITGTHSPLDIAAGIAIGGAIVAAAVLLAGRWLRRPLDAVAGWTLVRPGLGGALLFLALFEVANTLENARDGARAAKSIAERLVSR
ncbi:MAG: phosphatase PAP2 family protein, partial [Allosphingosinicella sp.]